MSSRERQHSTSPVITLDPLSDGAFIAALSSMGLDRERIERLDRASGRSLTVLRRRLARSEALRSPEWGADEELGRGLVPMGLAGAWVADKEADQYLMAELAGCESYDLVERQFTRLLDLEDAPVWSVGGFHGVVSKVDALFGRPPVDDRGRHRPVHGRGGIGPVGAGPGTRPGRGQALGSRSIRQGQRDLVAIEERCRREPGPAVDSRPQAVLQTVPPRSRAQDRGPRARAAQTADRGRGYCHSPPACRYTPRPPRRHSSRSSSTTCRARNPW